MVTLNKVTIPTMAKAIVQVESAEPLVALKCSSCGANFNPSTKHCEYCGTWFGPPIQKRVANTIDNDVIVESHFAELIRASNKFKSLGLLSG
jgi:predicted amidophosphoribosyltransferase